MGNEGKKVAKCMKINSLLRFLCMFFFTLVQVSGGDDSSIIISSYLTGKSVSKRDSFKFFHSLNWICNPSLLSFVSDGVYLHKALFLCVAALFVRSVYLLWFMSCVYLRNDKVLRFKRGFFQFYFDSFESTRGFSRNLFLWISGAFETRNYQLFICAPFFRSRCEFSFISLSISRR